MSLTRKSAPFTLKKSVVGLTQKDSKAGEVCKAGTGKKNDMAEHVKVGELNGDWRTETALRPKVDRLSSTAVAALSSETSGKPKPALDVHKPAKPGKRKHSSASSLANEKEVLKPAGGAELETVPIVKRARGRPPKATTKMVPLVQIPWQRLELDLVRDCSSGSKGGGILMPKPGSSQESKLGITLNPNPDPKKDNKRESKTDCHQDLKKDPKQVSKKKSKHDSKIHHKLDVDQNLAMIKSEDTPLIAAKYQAGKHRKATTKSEDTPPVPARYSRDKKEIKPKLEDASPIPDKHGQDKDTPPIPSKHGHSKKEMKPKLEDASPMPSKHGQDKDTHPIPSKHGHGKREMKPKLEDASPMPSKHGQDKDTPPIPSKHGQDKETHPIPSKHGHGKREMKPKLEDTTPIPSKHGQDKKEMKPKLEYTTPIPAKRKKIISPVTGKCKKRRCESGEKHKPVCSMPDLLVDQPKKRRLLTPLRLANHGSGWVAQGPSSSRVPELESGSLVDILPSSFRQPLDQPMNHPTERLVNKCVNWPMNRPMNHQDLDQHLNHSVDQHMSQPLYQSAEEEREGQEESNTTSLQMNGSPGPDTGEDSNDSCDTHLSLDPSYFCSSWIDFQSSKGNISNLQQLVQPQNNRTSKKPVLSTAAPSMTAPSIASRSMTAPSNAAPSIAAPSIAAPSTASRSMTAPSIAAPSMTAPSIAAPSTASRSMTAPSMTAPSMTAPSMTAPSMTARSTAALSTTAPSMTAPSMTAPSMTARSTAALSMTAPSTAALSMRAPSMASRSIAAPSIAAPSTASRSITAPSIASRSKPARHALIRSAPGKQSLVRIVTVNPSPGVKIYARPKYGTQAVNGSRSVPGQAVPGQAVNGQAVNGQAVPGQAVSRQAVNGQAVNGQAVPGQVVPGQAVPGQAVNGQAVNGQAVNGQAVNGQAVPRQAVPRQAVNKRAVNGQAVNGQAVNGQAVPRQAVPGQAVPGQAVNGRAVNGQAVPRQAVNGQAVPRQAVPGQAVPGQAVNGRAVNGQAVNGQAVNGQAVPGQAVNGQAVNGRAVNGQPVPGQVVPGQAVNGQAVNGQAVNGQAVNGQAVNRSRSMPGQSVNRSRSMPVPGQAYKSASSFKQDLNLKLLRRMSGLQHPHQSKSLSGGSGTDPQLRGPELVLKSTVCPRESLPPKDLQPSLAVHSENLSPRDSLELTLAEPAQLQDKPGPEDRNVLYNISPLSSSSSSSSFSSTSSSGEYSDSDKEMAQGDRVSAKQIVPSDSEPIASELIDSEAIGSETSDGELHVEEPSDGEESDGVLNNGEPCKSINEELSDEPLSEEPSDSDPSDDGEQDAGKAAVPALHEEGLQSSPDSPVKVLDIHAQLLQDLSLTGDEMERSIEDLEGDSHKRQPKRGHTLKALHVGTSNTQAPNIPATPNTCEGHDPKDCAEWTEKIRKHHCMALLLGRKCINSTCAFQHETIWLSSLIALSCSKRSSADEAKNFCAVMHALESCGSPDLIQHLLEHTAARIALASPVDGSPLADAFPWRRSEARQAAVKAATSQPYNDCSLLLSRLLPALMSAEAVDPEWTTLVSARSDLRLDPASTDHVLRASLAQRGLARSLDAEHALHLALAREPYWQLLDPVLLADFQRMLYEEMPVLHREMRVLQQARMPVLTTNIADGNWNVIRRRLANGSAQFGGNLTRPQTGSGLPVLGKIVSDTRWTQPLRTTGQIKTEMQLPSETRAEDRQLNTNAKAVLCCGVAMTVVCALSANFELRSAADTVFSWLVPNLPATRVFVVELVEALAQVKDTTRARALPHVTIIALSTVVQLERQSYCQEALSILTTLCKAGISLRSKDLLSLPSLFTPAGLALTIARVYLTCNMLRESWNALQGQVTGPDLKQWADVDCPGLPHDRSARDELVPRLLDAAVLTELDVAVEIFEAMLRARSDLQGRLPALLDNCVSTVPPRPELLARLMNLFPWLEFLCVHPALVRSMVVVLYDSLPRLAVDLYRQGVLGRIYPVTGNVRNRKLRITCFYTWTRQEMAITMMLALRSVVRGSDNPKSTVIHLEDIRDGSVVRGSLGARVLRDVDTSITQATLRAIAALEAFRPPLDILRVRGTDLFIKEHSVTRYLSSLRRETECSPHL